MSVRLRLTLWYAAVLSAALALFGCLIFFSLQHRMLGEIDRDLEGTSARFQAYFTTESSTLGEDLPDELNEFCQALPPSVSITLRGSDGFMFHYPTGTRAALQQLRTIDRKLNVAGVSYELRTAISASEAQHTLELLRNLLLGLTPLVILIACAGGAWMSRRALKPVQDITAAALNIGIDNLSDRLPVPATGDEIARLTEVLNLMFTRLETAVKGLSRFVADASHELRTPLAVIRATAEVPLRRERTADEYREALAGIVTETARMTQLVEDLLTLARGDAGNAAFPRKPVDINSVVEAVCDEMTSLAVERRLNLNTHYADQPAVVSGYRPSLHRLILALLDNAIKYSRPGGSVDVEISADPSQVRVAVKDSGPGIDPANMSHIFERFYRADPARSGGGHGLGLSLADSIARAHGAAITIESKEGEGSRFELVFPSAALRERDCLRESSAFLTKI